MVIQFVFLGSLDDKGLSLNTRNCTQKESEGSCQRNYDIVGESIEELWHSPVHQD